MKNANAPAHPTIYIQSGTGLTKREYFAIHILTGLSVVSIPGSHNRPDNQIQELVPQAVKMADALLSELDKTSY